MPFTEITTQEILNRSIKLEDVTANFLNGIDWNITDNNNDATITGLRLGTAKHDAACIDNIKVSLDKLSYQNRVLDWVNSPPTTVNEGDRYLIDTPATGAFSGHENEIAEYRYGNWFFISPVTGYQVFHIADGEYYIFDGVNWIYLKDFLSVINAADYQVLYKYGSYAVGSNKLQWFPSEEKLVINQNLIVSGEGNYSLAPYEKLSLFNDGYDTYITLNSGDMSSGILFTEGGIHYGLLRQLASNDFANGLPTGLHLYSSNSNADFYITANNNQIFHINNSIIDVKNKRIQNVADPVNSLDAVNLQTLQSYTSGSTVVTTEQHTNLPTGWYTIAVVKNTSSRGTARFWIRDIQSSRHESVVFYAAHIYGKGNNLAALIASHYNILVFTKIRIKYGSTYDGAALQVYIANSSNKVKAGMDTNFQYLGWFIKDFIPDSQDPGDVNWSNLTHTRELDVTNISEGGISVNRLVQIDSTKLYSDSSGGLKLQTNYGYLTHGPLNDSWCHFTTDRPKFYFNRAVTVDTGTISSYDEDLLLQVVNTTIFRANNSDKTIDLITNKVNVSKFNDSRLSEPQDDPVLELAGTNSSSILSADDGNTAQFSIKYNATFGTSERYLETGKAVKLNLIPDDTGPSLELYNAAQGNAANSINWNRICFIGKDYSEFTSEIQAQQGFRVALVDGNVPTSYNNWVRIASCRKNGYGIFKVCYSGFGGVKGTVIFNAGISDGRGSYSSLRLINNSYHGNSVIIRARIIYKSDSTSYLEIYVRNQTGYPLTLYVSQHEINGSEWDLFDTLQLNPVLPYGYSTKTMPIYARLYADSAQTYITKSGTITAKYFRPSVNYKSADGSNGVTRTIQVIGGDWYTKYTLVIKNGIITQISSTT